MTSLVFGLVFAGVVALWALVRGDVLDWPDVGYLAPVLLIVIGVAGLVVSIAGGRRRDAAEADPSADTVDAVDPADPVDAADAADPTNPSDRTDDAADGPDEAVTVTEARATAEPDPPAPPAR